MGLTITKLPDGRVEITGSDGDKVYLQKGSQIETSNSAISNLMGKINSLEKEIRDLKYRLDKVEN